MRAEGAALDVTAVDKIEKLQELVNADAALVRRGQWLSADMMLEIGDARHLVKIREGRIYAMSRRCHCWRYRSISQ